MKKFKRAIAFSAIFAMALGVGLLISNNKKQVEAKADGKKDLSEVISFGASGYAYQYIDNFFADFNLSEDIAPGNHVYANDHWQQLKENSKLNFYDGVVINDKTLGEWIVYDDGKMGIYPNNTYVNAFPMSAGGKYGPVAAEIVNGSNKIAFKFVLEYFPMTNITITFKAGIFAMEDNPNYKLDNDLTFKSTLPTNSAEFGAIRFEKINELNEVKKEFTIKQAEYWRNNDNGLGYTYRFYVLWTNVPRNKALVSQACPADHYRYFYNDILLNNKPIIDYLSWARGNNKDFSEQTTGTADPLGNDWTINPAYAMEHPLGKQCANYDMAIQMSVVVDQDNYVFFIYIPEQMFVDLPELGTPLFGIKEDALWQSLDEEGNPILVRNTKTVDNSLGVNATDLTVETRADGAGILRVNMDDKFDVGYNFSDKKMGMHALDKILIDGKSINYWNENSPVTLNGFDYDGFKLEEILNKAIITFAQSDAENPSLQIIIHPDLWAEWKNSNHIVSIPANLGTYKDGGAEYYYIKNDFSSSSLDYFLGEITNILDGAYSGDALASVKAKLNALPTFAKNAFDNNDEYASYRATVANWELEKYKDDANAELMNYKAGEFREDEENDRVGYINAAALDIADATTTAAVDTIVSDTKALIDNLKTAAEYDAEELAGYKEAAVNELNNYKNEEDYLEADWQEIQGLINSGVSEINAATNKQGVDDALSTSKALINAVPNKEARELAASKLAATTELNAIDTSIYREEEKAEVQAIIATATTNINNATSKEDVATLLANAKATIALIKTDAQKTAEELAEAKVEAKNELESYKNDEGLFREAEANRRLEIVNSGKEAIDNAENKEAVNTALANAKGEIDALKTAAQYEEEEAFINAKAAAKKEIEDYATSKGESNYSTRGWAEIQSYVDTGKQSIDSDNCNTQSKINQIVSNVKSLIDTVITKDAEELEAAKNNAINDLREYYNNIDASKYTQENVNKLALIKDDGERAIEAATSIEAVNSALADAKAKLDAVEKVSPAKSNSCGGNIMATSLILSSVALIGATLLVLKKRKDY